MSPWHQLPSFCDDAASACIGELINDVEVDLLDEFECESQYSHKSGSNPSSVSMLSMLFDLPELFAPLKLLLCELHKSCWCISDCASCGCSACSCCGPPKSPMIPNGCDWKSLNPKWADWYAAIVMVRFFSLINRCLSCDSTGMCHSLLLINGIVALATAPCIFAG